ncbi:MAG: transporter substrate-binding protein, partial [Planctomycetaceae bacterium]|nr:transporter substrate-binding protein [Planctomycetaceae bacterium]
MLFAGLIATVLSVGCSSSTTTESSSNEVELEDIANQGLTEEEVGSVKIGILHSLSGTMAISESSLVDAVQLAVDEINAAGGVLGKTIEPVVVDPASDWDL